MIRYFCCFLARNYLPLPVVHPPNPLRLPPPTNPGLPINCHFYIPLKLPDSSQTCASHPLLNNPPANLPLSTLKIHHYLPASTRRLRPLLLLLHHQMPQLSTNPHSPQTKFTTAHPNPPLNDSLPTALRQPAHTLPNCRLLQMQTMGGHFASCKIEKKGRAESAAGMRVSLGAGPESMSSCSWLACWLQQCKPREVKKLSR